MAAAGLGAFQGKKNPDHNNAPLFASFIFGMFWKRMTATAGWVGLVSGTVGAVISIVVSLVTAPKPASEPVGLVQSETPRDHHDAEESVAHWWLPPAKLALLSLVIIVNIIFH